MRKKTKHVLLGIVFTFFTLCPFSFSSDFTTLEEKQVYYEQLENARSTWLGGGNLTKDQVKLLEDEGLINRDELDRTGGPDVFGYEFIDNEEENGPAYEWVDITGTGEVVTGLADDNHAGPFDIGFEFPFYDEIYTEFYVQSNGAISFTDQYISLGNTAIPNPLFDALIAWFWDDLNPNNGGTVYFEVIEIEGRDVLCILYDEYHDYSPAAGWTTSQVLMFESGKVVITYDQIEDGMDNVSCSVGIQNAEGSDGLEYVYINNPAGYPYPGLQIQFSANEDAVITGVVTDADAGDPIEGAQVDLYYADELESLQTVFTNDLGEFTMFIEEEGTFDISAYAATYVQQLVEDIVVVESDVLIQDFALEAETETVLVNGIIVSADTPGTPVEGVIVNMPEIGEIAITNANGIFNLGQQIIGEYTFQVGHNPIGSEGYHNLELYNVEVNADNTPFTFELFEILPTTNLTAMSGNELVTLSWTEPANHPGNVTLQMVDEQIEVHIATLDRFRANGAADERAKIPYIEQELHRLQSMRKALLRQDELDQITDFMGFRIKLFHPDGTETIPPDYIMGDNFAVTGLANGALYGFAVAADYGYDEAYLAWSEVVETRPLPVGEYVFMEVEYEWIEINPDNGGAGTVILDTGDDANSGMQAMQGFNFFGTYYDQLSACSNGWLSFLHINTTIGPQLPSTSEPNATVVGLNVDTDCEMAGDELAIWMYDDEENEQIIFQFYVAPYSGLTDYRYSYQIVLDVNSSSIQMNYEWADDWMYLSRGGAVVGIEDEVGEIAYAYDMNNLEDETSIKFILPEWDWGGINGSVFDSDTGDPVEGVEVVATDTDNGTWLGMTDANGYFTVLVDNTLGPWDLSLSKPGYYTATIEEITIPEEEFSVTLDDVLLDVVSIGYTDDFEAYNGIWTVSENNIPGDIEWGVPTAGPMEDHTLEGENCWATVLDGNHTGPINYGELRGDTLMSTVSWPVIDAEAHVVYWHWVEYFETANILYGGYNFQISTDFGQTWEMLEPLDGYTGIIDYLGYYDSNIWTWFPEAGFGSNSDGWEQVAFPIGEYIGEDVMFMFHSGNCFESDYWRFGYAIDDIRIHGVIGANSPARIYGIVTDSGTGEPISNATVSLYNAEDGEHILTELTNEMGGYLILLAEGLYDICVVSNNYLQSCQTDVILDQNAELEINFELEPGIGAGYTEHLVDGNFDGVRWVTAGDVDSDGDLDILGAGYESGEIVWWENVDGEGGFTTEHIIGAGFAGAHSVVPVDLDSDGDIDVIGAAYYNDLVTLWQNNGDQVFTEHILSNTFDGAMSICVVDINGDSDLDIVGAANEMNTIQWWENEGGDDFSIHVLEDTFEGARFVSAADIDEDGDNDILGAAELEDEIKLWKNNGNETFTAYTISSTFTGAQTIYPADINGDGDIDVLGAAFTDGVSWWENDGNENFTQHIITDGFFEGTRCAYPTDLDHDDDIDVIVSGTYRQDIAMWINDGNNPPSFTYLTLGDSLWNSMCVAAADLDDDGDQDILGTSFFSDDVIWWENSNNPPLSFAKLLPDNESTITDNEVTVSWEETVDPDENDHIFYRLEWSIFEDFNISYSMETVETSFTITDLADEVMRLVEDNELDDLPDETAIYWRVKAIDSFGLGTWANGNEDSWWFYIILEPLTLFATPWDDPTMIFPNGGSFRWDATVINNSIGEYEFDAWTELILPDGNPYGPLDLFENIPIMGDSTFAVSPVQYVPAAAPNGMYTYIAKVGDYPNAIAEDSFPFGKLPLAGLVAAADFNSSGWVLTGWFDEYLSTTDVEEDNNSLPLAYSLADPYPNPFNPATSITIGLPDAALLQVTVYNILGQKVEILTHNKLNAGYHNFTFDGSNLSSGIYFIHANVPGKMSEIRKVVLMK